MRLQGWGSPNSNEGTYTVVLYIYKYFVVVLLYHLGSRIRFFHFNSLVDPDPAHLDWFQFQIDEKVDKKNFFPENFKRLTIMVPYIGD